MSFFCLQDVQVRFLEHQGSRRDGCGLEDCNIDFAEGVFFVRGGSQRGNFSSISMRGSRQISYPKNLDLDLGPTPKA